MDQGKCPICNNFVDKVIVSEKIKYKEKETVVTGLVEEICSQCGESFFDKDSTKRLDDEFKKLRFPE